MTFDDNSTCQHFKGVLVSLVTPNEADWYVNYLCHIYTHKKLPIGIFQQATFMGSSYSRKTCLLQGGTFRFPTIISVNIAFLNVLPQCLANGVPLPLSIAKIRTIFHSAMDCLHYLTKKLFKPFVPLPVVTTTSMPFSIANLPYIPSLKSKFPCRSLA